MAKKLKASIISISYNHEKYIQQTLNSFAMQKANFNYEIIIGDDCSSDNTQAIIREFEKQYHGKMTAILRKQNIGISANLFDVLKKAKGDYIFICEGDDYWIDENKLQTQVDFLEKHTEYSVCFHPVIIEEEGVITKDIFPTQTSGFGLTSLLKQNFIQTNSVAYRRQNYSRLDSDILPTDWYLHIIHAQNGKIGFIDKNMSVYRKHSGGVWAGVRDNQEEFWTKHGAGHLNFYKVIYDLPGYNERQREIIVRNIANTSRELVEYSRNAQVDLEGFVKANPETIVKVMIDLHNEQDKLRKKIHEQAIQIGEKNETINNLVIQLKDIKSSKVWKLRNVTASLIGKSKIE